MEILSTLNNVTYIKIVIGVFAFIFAVKLIKRLIRSFKSKWNMIDDAF